MNIIINWIKVNLKYKLLVDIIALAVLSSSSNSCLEEAIEGAIFFPNFNIFEKKLSTSSLCNPFSISLY